MITREEMQAALKKKERQASKAVKDQAQKTIEYASRRIKAGWTHIANAPSNPEVISLVQKAFKKEGIDVKVEIVEAKSSFKGKSPHVKRCAIYRFSLAEEE